MTGRMQPAAVVAMVGAGQLARMTQQAAVDLAVELRVLARSADEPAVLAGAPAIFGDPGDPAALHTMAAGADVLTFDHELVPAQPLRDLVAAGHRVHPGPDALAAAQDKLHARRLLGQAGFPVPAFCPVAGPEDVERFAAEHGWPVVLKARSGGYDGRGVIVARHGGDLPEDLARRAADGGPTWLAEAHVELAAELAVLVARRPSGATVTYPVAQTTQVDGICRHLVTPAGVADDLAWEAAELAQRVVQHVGGTGVCAVELFVGPAGRLLVNELALRPHNSGHATIEANATSQFHQHLRAVLDWPLGPTELRAPAAAMVNLIPGPGAGDPVANLPAALEVPGAHVHLYAKASRPGRKVGHVTALGASTTAALDVAARTVDILLQP